MSNDLLFSILPRNTKVPVESDNRVKKVARSEKSEALNQDEKEQHDEVHIVDEMEQRERHQKQEGNLFSDQEEHEQDNDSEGEATQTQSKEDRSQPNGKGTKPKVGLKHVDITV